MKHLSLSALAFAFGCASASPVKTSPLPPAFAPLAGQVSDCELFGDERQTKMLLKCADHVELFSANVEREESWGKDRLAAARHGVAAASVEWDEGALPSAMPVERGRVLGGERVVATVLTVRRATDGSEIACFSDSGEGDKRCVLMTDAVLGAVPITAR